MVIVTPSTSGEFGTLAANLAEKRDARLVTNTNRVDPGESIVYVAAPDEISPATLRQLQELCMHHPPYRLNCRVITGRTVTEARELYARSQQDPSAGGMHHLAVRDLERQVALDDERSNVLTHQDVTTDALERTADTAGSLSTVLHGTNMYSRLEDGILVGAPLDPEAFDFDPPQPPFVRDDGARLAVEKPVLRAEHLDVPQIFLNGCSSVLSGVNDGKEYPVHVVLSLLANARTFIGTYRITECIPHHGALHHALLRAGYRPAERAYLLNNSAMTSGIDYYPYIIAGDPNVDPTDPLPTDYDTTLRNTVDGHLDIFVDDVDTPVFDIQVPADMVPDDSPEFFLRRRVGGDSPTTPDDCFFTAFREGDHVRVVIWSWGRMTAERLGFRICAARSAECPPAEDDEVSDQDSVSLSTIPTAVREAEARQWTAPISNDARKQLRQSRAAISTANARLANERYDADAFRQTVETLRRAEKHLETARREVLEGLLSDRSANSLQDAYIDNVDTRTPQVADRDCPYCGGSVFLRPTQDAFGEMARDLGICPNCSYAFDVPSDAHAALPELHGQFYGPGGDTVPLTVVVENPLDRPTDAVVKLTVSADHVSAKTAFEEPERRIVLEPGERRRLSVTLDQTGVSVSSRRLNRRAQQTHRSSKQKRSPSGSTVRRSKSHGTRSPWRSKTRREEIRLARLSILMVTMCSKRMLCSRTSPSLLECGPCISECRRNFNCVINKYLLI